MRFSLLDSLAIASVIVPATQATPETTHITSHVPGKAFDRFVTIWLENTDYSKAAGDPSLVSLAKKGITLSNYFAVTHPSQPNYISAIGGDHFGLDGDALVRVASNTSTVIDLLEDRSISWGEYQEDMPYSGYQGFDYPNQKTRAVSAVGGVHDITSSLLTISPERLCPQTQPGRHLRCQHHARSSRSTEEPDAVLCGSQPTDSTTMDLHHTEVSVDVSASSHIN